MASSTVTTSLRWIRMFVSRHRRAIAAALTGAAVVCALSVLRPPPPERIAVLAAAEDLAGGTRLSKTDLTTVALRPAVVPAGALRAGTDVTGRILASPARKGEPLTDVRLAGPPLLSEDELVATPVRIADAGVTRLLHAGDQIDVLAAATRGEQLGEPARVVAPDVRVLTVPNRNGRASRSVSPGPGRGSLIVLATTPDQAAALASAAVTSRLTITLRGR